MRRPRRSPGPSARTTSSTRTESDGLVRFATSATTRAGSVRPCSCRGRAPVIWPSSSTPTRGYCGSYDGWFARQTTASTRSLSESAWRPSPMNSTDRPSPRATMPRSTSGVTRAPHVPAVCMHTQRPCLEDTAIASDALAWAAIAAWRRITWAEKPGGAACAWAGRVAILASQPPGAGPAKGPPRRGRRRYILSGADTPSSERSSASAACVALASPRRAAERLSSTPSTRLRL